MTAPALAPTARPIHLLDLDELAVRTPILAGKLRRMDPRLLADIFNQATNEGTK